MKKKITQNKQTNQLRTVPNVKKPTIDKNLARGKIRKKTTIPADPGPSAKIPQPISKNYETSF